MSRSRRNGLVTLALLVGTTAVALTLADFYHLGGAQTLVAALVGGGAPAGLYLAWAQYRDTAAGTEAVAAMNLARVADRLADEVRDQWQREASALNQPYPLPVRWEAADPSLFADWAALTRLASSGVGWPVPQYTTGWAAAPGELAGQDSELADVLERVPTGRLVVLGDAGSGKTTLMIRLVLDPRLRPSSGAPVPVLVSVASWDPVSQDLHAWLAGRLSIDFPWLAESHHSADSAGNTHINELLANCLIVPVLDGLDEIADVVRGRAISEINKALRPGERLVVTSRTAQYRDALRPPSGMEVTLRAAAGITLCPLEAADTAGFLRAAAGGPQARAHWEPVIAALGSDAPVARVLSNPLMVSLASAIYDPGRGDASDNGPREPAELCALPGEEAIERHLFDEFIPAVYRARPAGQSPRDPWQAHQVQPWLEFLAAYLEQTVRGTDFAWWQVARAIPRSVVGLTAGLAAGLTFGLTAFLVAGLGPALAAGLAGGLAAALVAGIVPAVAARFNDPSMDRPRAEREAMACLAILVITGFVGAAGLAAVLAALLGTAEIAASLAAGLVTGLAAGLATGLASADDYRPASAAGWRPRIGSLLAGLVFGVAGGLVVGLTAGRSAGLAGGVAVGLAAAAAAGWHGVPDENASAPTPEAALASDRHAALGPMLSYGLAAGLPAGLAAGLSQHPVFGLPHGLAAGLVLAVATGLPFGLFYGPAAVSARWLDWALARSYLAMCARMPWRPMAFLEDAHARGVMRQAGTVYQFRHLELQRRLAYRRRLGREPPRRRKAAAG